MSRDCFSNLSLFLFWVHSVFPRGVRLIFPKIPPACFPLASDYTVKEKSPFHDWICGGFKCEIPCRPVIWALGSCWWCHLGSCGSFGSYNLLEEVDGGWASRLSEPSLPAVVLFPYLKSVSTWSPLLPPHLGATAAAPSSSPRQL